VHPVEEMMSNKTRIQLVNCGSDTHLTDVIYLRERGFALPHQYVGWCLQSQPKTWKWCRAIDEDNNLITGFAISINNSKAMPGAKIGRIERFGRALHAQLNIDPGYLLTQIIKGIPNLIRLVVEIYDEDEERRSSLIKKIEMAGAQRPHLARQYSSTLFVDLKESDEQLLKSLGQHTRRAIASTKKRGGIVHKIDGKNYINRMKVILDQTFQRTGGTIPPDIDFDAMCREAVDGLNSLLVGVFWPGRSSPQDLVAFAWARHHGDIVCYDVAASERAEDIGSTPLMYILFWELFHWARQRNALWVDLGGVINPDESPDHPLYGISAFKRRLSKDERIVGAELWFEPVTILSLMAKSNRWLARRFGLLKD
jgi:hypothetical protein